MHHVVTNTIAIVFVIDTLRYEKYIETIIIGYATLFVRVVYGQRNRVLLVPALNAPQF